MTEEEKKAIAQLEIEYNFLNTKSKEFKDLSYLEERLKESISVALNLINKQQKEIEKQNNVIDKICKNPFNTLTVDGITFAGTDISNILKIN